MRSNDNLTCGFCKQPINKFIDAFLLNSNTNDCFWHEKCFVIRFGEVPYTLLDENFRPKENDLILKEEN